MELQGKSSLNMCAWLPFLNIIIWQIDYARNYYLLKYRKMVVHYSCAERIQISILNKHECQVSNINTYIHVYIT